MLVVTFLKIKSLQISKYIIKVYDYYYKSIVKINLIQNSIVKIVIKLYVYERIRATSVI